ncbi:MAG: hypothetical protein HOH74_23700 [Gemmatimonadetes bacterium]|jgi:hypothetical protein|nr:hypothetical protein [Gemmatimonadota bacterium]MBT6148459.1 hypothetical protein [Gemmatimonadota bacterium]
MSTRKRIAALVSIYRKHAHAQHIVDRFLEGYGWNGRHHRPDVDVVALYVDQVGDDDVSGERAARHEGLTIYPTIGDALTCGGSDLAVDGVLLIAEHGDYAVNDKGQTLWPRYEFFQQMATVFRSCGRSVPVFNDKHLSWNWDWARAMYDTSLELDFPFMAGSSLPITWRTPSIDMPLGATVEEAMCVCSSWIDGGDFHAYETVQSMVERRAGGETGVKWVKSYRGDELWQAHHDGVWSRELFEACLCRSHQLTPARPGFNNTLPTIDDLRQLVKDPWAYQYEHHDGLRCTIFAANGLVGDFNFAARLGGRDEPLSTQMYLPVPTTKSLASFFSPQVHHIEAMLDTGKTSYPVERTLLTTGLTAAGLDSRAQEDEVIQTPHLHFDYTASTESTYWRT